MTTEEFLELVGLEEKGTLEAVERACESTIEEYERQQQKIPVKTTRIILQRKIDLLRETFPEIRNRYLAEEAYNLLGEVNELIDQRQFSRAQVKVSRARELVGDFAEGALAHKLQETQAIIDDARAPEEADALKEFSGKLNSFYEVLGKDGVEAAGVSLAEVDSIGLQLTREGIRERLEEAHKALGKKTQEAETASRIEAERAALDQILESDDIEAARKSIESLEGLLCEVSSVDDEEFVDRARERIRRIEAKQERIHELTSSIEKVEAALAEGELDAAASNLGAVDSLMTEDDEELGGRVDKLRRSLEMAQAEKTLESAASALEEGQFEEVERLLGQLEAKTLPDRDPGFEDRLHRLRSRIQEETTRAEREDELESLRRNVERALEGRRLDEADAAIGRLETLSADPDYRELVEAIDLGSYRDQLGELKSIQKSEKKFRSSLDRIDLLLDRGDASEAKKALDVAETDWMEGGLSEGRDRLKERRERLAAEEADEVVRRSVRENLAAFGRELGQDNPAEAKRHLDSAEKLLKKDVKDPVLAREIETAREELKKLKGPGVVGKLWGSLSGGGKEKGARPKDWVGSIVVVEGPRSGEEFELLKGRPLTFGRKGMGKTVDSGVILFDDPSRRMSASQAVIAWSAGDDAPCLESPGGMQPNLLNGRPLPAGSRSPLSDGDRITLPGSRPVVIQFTAED